MINMRAKMSGFIFPNVPISDFERAAFERAVNYQIEHERQRRAAYSELLLAGLLYRGLEGRMAAHVPD